MLSVLTEKGYMPIENRQNYYIEMNYDGFHRLSFDVSNNDPINKYLVNEAVIKNEDNRFLIKDVNRRAKNTSYNCDIDLDEWKENIFFDTANDTRFQTKTLGEILDVIKPNNWQIINASVVSIKRTPELKDATPHDIFVSLEDLYSVVFDIRVLSKEVYVVNPNAFKYDGLYATAELNMSKATWQGSSKEFGTRLFAYGKIDESGNAINISSVNEGKEYVENHTYTNKVITLLWRDERYTDPQSLYEDALKKLEQICIPNMSYDITIYDLAKINKEYDFLQFGLYKQVKTFINDKVSILQKVVTYKRYYDKHDKNIITLSNEQQKFTSKVSSVLGGSLNNVINGSFLEQAQKDSLELINDFSTKGHRYETENETYFLDKLPKEVAKFVMRQNLGGIAFSQNGWAGPYITAWTIDGKFNADFITAGTLRAIKIEAAEIFGGSININEKFIVNSDGKLKATDADISGKINAQSGYIGGLEVDGKVLKFSAPSKVSPHEGAWINGIMNFILNAGGSSGNDIFSFNFLDETGSVFSSGFLQANVISIDNVHAESVASSSITARDYLYAKSATIDSLNTSSTIDKKKSIQPFLGNALEEILNTDVYSYKLKNECVKGAVNIPTHYGFVIGEGYKISEKILGRDKDSVDLYNALAIAYKAIAEQQEQINDLVGILKGKGVIECTD